MKDRAVSYRGEVSRGAASVHTFRTSAALRNSIKRGLNSGFPRANGLDARISRSVVEVERKYPTWLGSGKRVRTVCESVDGT
jgi:hypothetical protein